MSRTENSVAQQIYHLISNLTNKKSYKGVADEISKLVATFGLTAEKLMLSTLLKEIDFKDRRIGNGNKNQFKVQFLNQELSNLSVKPEFLDYFSQIFPSGDIEPTFEDIVLTLNFSLPVQLLLALSLALSNNVRISGVGIQILKRKLRDYYNLGRPQRIPPYALHQLLSLIRTRSEFQNVTGSEAAIINDCYQFLVDSNPLMQSQEFTEFLPLLRVSLDTANLENKKQSLARDYSQVLTLGNVLEDLGPCCSQTPNALREVLAEFPKIQESEMAEAIVVICNKEQEMCDYETKVVATEFGGIQRQDWQVLQREVSDKKAKLMWNIDVISRVVKELYSHLNWYHIIEQLDHPKFSVKNESCFNLITSLYYKICNQQFPINPFFRDWQNPAGQVSFLLNAIYSNQPLEIFSFDQTPHSAPIADVSYPQNFENKIRALSSLDLLTTLIEQSVTESYLSIKSTLVEEARNFPDILVVGLAMISPRRGKHLHEELINMLMPTYISPQTTNQAALQNIWEYNPNLIIKACIERYEKDNSSIVLNQILDLTQDIKDSLISLAGCDNQKFSVHFGLLASNRDFLHLDQWVKDRVRNTKDDFVIELINYLYKYLVIPLQQTNENFENLLEKAFLSKDSITIIFEILISQSSQNLMSPQTQQYVMKVYNEITRLKPDLNEQTFNTEEVEEAANRHFQQLYSNKISIDSIIELMRRFKNSQSKFENEVFNCMINNLFDEYRFFHRYPERELQLTGELYGAIINNDLLAGITLGVALKQVLESLRRSFGKLYRFGWCALEKFKDKLHTWPLYSQNLIELQTLKIEQPEFVAKLQEELNKQNSGQIEENVVEERKNAWERNKVQVTESPPISEPTVPEFENINTGYVKVVIDEMTQDRIMFIINTTSQHNIDEKANELREILGLNEGINLQWFANYLVVKRASMETNFHQLYLMLLQKLEIRHVFKVITVESYTAVRHMLMSRDLLQENERKVLKSLGSWVGALTLARNKAIVIKFLDIKELVIQAYEQGKLLAIIPFTCKVMENCQNSVVFVTTNPWVTSILSLLLEIKDLPDLALTLAINIDITFRHLQLEVQEFPRSKVLSNRKILQRSGDFNIKESANLPEEIEIPEQSLIKTLPDNVIVNSKIIEHFPEKEIRRLIALAVETAVKQIIHPIVARSINIAILTTRELCLKDFAFERNSDKLDNASKWMVKSLAGSLAIVTGKEPFRVELVKQLSELLRSQTSLNQNIIKQIVDTASIENFELGSKLVAKAVIEKALRDLSQDEKLSEAINNRKVYGDRSFDENAAIRSRYLQFLPQKLRPNTQGLTHDQFQVYKDFLTIIEKPKVQQPVPNSPEPEFLQAQDAVRQLEVELQTAEQQYSQKLDIRDLQVQQSIKGLVKRCIATSSPEEVQMACAQKLFKRLYTNENYVEFYIGVMAALKSYNRRIVKDITSWLLHIDEGKRYNLRVVSSLLKDKLVNILDYDLHISKRIDQEHYQTIQFCSDLIYQLCIQDSTVSHTEIQNIISSLQRYSVKYPDNFDVVNVLQAMNIASNFGKGVLNAQQEKYREVINSRFQDWLHFTLDYPFINSEKVPAFVKSIENYGLLTGHDNMEFFFKTLIEQSIRRSVYEGQADYQPIDSFTKLAHVIVVLAQPKDKILRLKKLFACITNAMISQHQAQEFNQKYYYRILFNILTDCSQPIMSFPQLENILEQLIPFANALHQINPNVLPEFGVGWLELVSHRFFLPKMLRADGMQGKISKQWNKMYFLIMDLLKFIQLHYSETPISNQLKTYYQAVIKLFMILEREFPDFLCEFHCDFISMIPDTCGQLKNFILAANPSYMQIPDPLTPNLKVDLLQNMSEHPKISSKYQEILQKSQIFNDINYYIETKDPTCVNSIIIKISNSSYSVQRLMNPIVLYLTHKILLKDPREANEIFQLFINTFDNEKRKHFINAITNQLRYPNTHTQLLSRVCLSIFYESRALIQEQITRALTERVMVQYPQPWGILITFIELVRNPRYEFFSKPFARATPEIESLFEVKTKAFIQGK